MIPELDTPIKQEIEKIEQAAFEIFDLEKPRPGIDLLIEAYHLIPQPRNTYSESFNLLKYISTGYFRSGLIDESEKWLADFLESDYNVRRYGESEYLAGKIALKRNEKAKAIEYFIIANQKSEGRVFSGDEEKEYFSFFKSNAKEHVRPTDFNKMLEAALKEIGSKNFVYALSLLYDCLNIQLDNPVVHLKKGICHFELNQLNQAADSFTRAYMLEGAEIFKNEDAKYLEFLKTKIQIH